MGKFIIIAANTCHPSGELKFLMVADEYGDTIEFESREEAKDWIIDSHSDIWAYTIIDTEEFVYQ